MWYDKIVTSFTINLDKTLIKKWGRAKSASPCLKSSCLKTTNYFDNSRGKCVGG